jgi:mannose/cellobiose epimerase-like protein (N-acyl-D-glucosamine 2-epimerase family)
MTSQAPPRDALDAVRQFEHELQIRGDVADSAATKLDAARAEAARLLASARRAGMDAGCRAREAVLAEAETQATAIRATADAQAQRFRDRVADAQKDLVAELTAELWPRKE